MTLLTGTQTVMFALAVGCVATAFASARHHHASDQTHAGPWWRGARRSVKPAVGLGWALFVILNVAYGLAQPLVAGSLFLRAYVLRAMCLRRTRR